MSYAAASPSSRTHPMLSPDARTATVYGPPPVRQWTPNGTQQYQQQQQQYEEWSPDSFDSSAPAAGDSPSRGRHGGTVRTAFYNTRAGEAVIAAARAELSARANPAASASLQQSDNHQRVFHSECVLPLNSGHHSPSVLPSFQRYPLGSFGAGELQPARVKSPSKARLDVQRRHDLVKNIKKNKSDSNWDKNRNFIAKHTNNLVSC